MRPPRSRAALLGAALLPAVLFAPACRRAGALRFEKAPVVLVSVDTLRADHLPAFGYTGVETPHLDALRADGVLFTSAYSQVPLTLPSHTSLMTGVYPAETGVRDNLGFHRLPSVPTLAQLLKQNGYATGAAVSSIVLAGESGMKDGFDLYDDSIEATVPGLGLGAVQRAGADTEKRLEQWIAAQDRKTPVFAFLHLYEPHTPYEPPEPWKTRYASRPYDGEIATADDVVGRLLSFLKERGLYDRALVVFVSDHGEGLGDHGEDEHGVFLYRATLHVPLIVKLPNRARAGEKVDDTVGLVDVVPTVLATVLPGLQPPATRGVALTRYLSSTRPEPRRIFSETVFPRLHYGWSDLASVVEGSWHYIEAPRAEIYDMSSDPVEMKDLSSSLPPAFRSLRLEAQKLRVSRVEAPKESDPEQAKKLASLGYFGSVAASADAKDLADPKDKALLVRDMKRGFGLLADDHFEEAAAVFREVLKSEPKMVDVWNGLSQAAKKAGHGDEALHALEEAARLSPGGGDLFVPIGSLALELGKLDVAKQHAELARKSGGAEVHELLASIALAEKDYDAALKEADEVERIHPERRMPKLLRARALAKKGRLPEALAEVEKVAAASKDQKPIMTMHQIRGDVLARTGKEAEGEREFLEELRLFPENVEAYQDLALLYASQGNGPKLYATLDQMMQKVPGRQSRDAAAKVLDLVGDHRSAAAIRAGRVAAS
jgi:arylsulfatase A-like enzyme/tetratricopeptide (TPR) repeat protein